MGIRFTFSESARASPDTIPLTNFTTVERKGFSKKSEHEVQGHIHVHDALDVQFFTAKRCTHNHFFSFSFILSPSPLCYHM